jgi:uncharacterized protein
MSSQISKAIVDDFVCQKKLAVVGVSGNPRKFGAAVYRELKERGYRVFAVNRNAESVQGDRCYPSLQALPESVDGVVVVVPPAETEKVVREAEAASIKRIWMQRGAESKEAIDFCREHDLNAIHGECILMFIQPVRSIHKFHRVINGLFSQLPR